MADLPVDLSRLAAQTGNDPGLERDVLRLYLDKTPGDVARLKAASSAEERRQAAHLIAGSARAIGAGKVARLAAAIEKQPSGRPEVLAALGRAADEACRFIAGHLGRPPAAG